jgi:hypothetical protein
MQEMPVLFVEQSFSNDEIMAKGVKAFHAAGEKGY